MKSKNIQTNSKMNIGLFPYSKTIAKELDELEDQYNFHIINPHNYEKNELNRWTRYCKAKKIISVSSFSHQNIYFQTLINEKMGASGLSKKACLYAINKFLNRTLEDEPFWFGSIRVDETDQQLLRKIKSYPFMLKSTLHNCGSFIYKINTPKELINKINEFRQSEYGKIFRKNSEDYLSFCSLDETPKIFPYLIAEKFINLQENVKQFSIDCYANDSGHFCPFVVREEVYFSNLQKIGYMCPPPSLNKTQLLALDMFIKAIGKKFQPLGFINQFFNIECWLTDVDKFYLTEINIVPNTHFLGMYALMEKKSLIKTILELHHQHIQPHSTPFEKIKDGTLKKCYLQTEINCRLKGKASDIFDFNALKTIEENKAYHLTYVINDRNFNFTAMHQSMPGWPVAEIYHEGNTIQEVLDRDLEFRKAIYKVKQ